MSKIRVGVGFATGRKNFRNVLKSYILSWQESGLMADEDVELHVYVAYDLAYKDTKISDYTLIPKEIKDLIFQAHFLGKEETASVEEEFVQRNITDASGASLVFSGGYAAHRNLILFSAIKDGMDCLLFLDDDEYPLAVTRNSYVAIWSGQQVLKMHLQNIWNADITFGYHCGYVSPIPAMNFPDEAEKQIPRILIEALSNDIVNWNTLEKVIRNGGVTYADTDILRTNETIDVPEINHMKFISGSNLCINLTNPKRVFPFYNPPGARGEDTFLSTCLRDRKVLRVPCYTFHDGFSAYNHLLSGVLPLRLNAVDSTKKQTIQRFLSACVGWARYKPLYLYITQPALYQEKIDEAKNQLSSSLPYVCDYFHDGAFSRIQNEMAKYDKDVFRHYEDFAKVKEIWAKAMEHIGHTR